MKPEAVAKAFQNELVQLMNKYTGGQMNKKISARDRCRLAHDFQIYLLVCATKVLVPSGTKNAIESVIKSNCAQYEKFQRTFYRVEPEPTGAGNEKITIPVEKANEAEMQIISKGEPKD